MWGKSKTILGVNMQYPLAAALCFRVAAVFILLETLCVEKFDMIQFIFQ